MKIFEKNQNELSNSKQDFSKPSCKPCPVKGSWDMAGSWRRRPLTNEEITSSSTDLLKYSTTISSDEAFSDTTGRRHASHRSGVKATKEYRVKVILLGDTGVGKTSFVHCFQHSQFTEKLPPGPAPAQVRKVITHNDCIVDVRLQDTAGQERYRSLTASYYRNAHACLVCFNVYSQESFSSVEQWLEDLDTYKTSARIKTVLIGFLNCPQNVSKLYKASRSGTEHPHHHHPHSHHHHHHPETDSHSNSINSDLDLDPERAVPRGQAEHLAQRLEIPYHEMDLRADPLAPQDVIVQLLDDVVVEFSKDKTSFIKPESGLMLSSGKDMPSGKHSCCSCSTL